MSKIQNNFSYADKSGGGRFSALVQTGPGAHPASYTMGTESFQGVNRQGRDVDHLPSFSAEVKERVQLYLSRPIGSRSLSTVNFTFTFIAWSPYLRNRLQA